MKSTGIEPVDEGMKVLASLSQLPSSPTSTFTEICGGRARDVVDVAA